MYEINLVPDVKAEAIRAQKVRNLIFFVSGTVSAIAIGLVVLLVLIKAGQDITLGSQDKRLELLSGKLEEYDGLEEILTIQSQLESLENIRTNKKVFSRVFAILAAVVPTGADSVTLSKVDVDMNEAILSIEGQANAGEGTDGVDYRVLEAFSKQVGLMKYDYGRYVDESGNQIPTMCIRETDENGVTLKDEKGNVYGIWAKSVRGCDPSQKSEEGDVTVDEEAVEEALNENEEEQGENVETEGGDAVETVRIPRTPLYDDWYRSGYMSESGEITGVAHFESQCTNYMFTKDKNGKMVPIEENNCTLALGDLEVTESSNGKVEGGELVLRFEAQLSLNAAVLDYNNKHMIAVAPSGMSNVTDSYIQIGSIFSERAADLCEEGDKTCNKEEQ
ncbi:hypothetical protein IJI72_01250 [Candidatus Saccharibacteria bacterium]|nr:hypothetical protein [Candidatus Saccharibacteria bacterium]